MSRILILAWGNPSRGDDGLGPAFAERASSIVVPRPHVLRVETDFQLQPEHAADLLGCDAALFADASVAAADPFSFVRVAPARDTTFTSHAMSPAAVLAAYRAAFGAEPPPAFALAIRGEAFEFGTGLSVAVGRRLDAALLFLRELVATGDVGAWRELAAEAGAQ
jgi:hydrogenase maturation protease